MKKRLRKIVSLAIMLAIFANIIFPVNAATTSEYDPLIQEVAQAFGEKYKDAESAATLIADLNIQLNESGGLGNLINVYADSVQGIFTNAAFMTIGSGVMGGILRVANLMKTFVSVGNLAGLYYNWSTRYSERMGIALGLFTWP